MDQKSGNPVNLDALLDSAQQRSKHGSRCWAELLRKQGGHAAEYIDHLDAIRDRGGYLNYAQIARDLDTFDMRRNAPNVARHFRGDCSCQTNS